MPTAAEESATCTYRMEEPFHCALKRLRSALSAAGLRISGEWDLAARFRRVFLVDIPSCTVLFAVPPRGAIHSIGRDPCGAAMAPMHVVVSARGGGTEVHLLRVLPRASPLLDPPTITALGQMQAAILHVLDTLGRRSRDN